MSDAAAAMDLLQDPLLTVDGPDGRVWLTLPELLVRLLQGPEVLGFPELAPEQRGYWWRFLVRCATKALHDLDRGPDDVSVAEVRDVLAGLVPPGGWCLFQPDHRLPGFLQVPAPDLRGYEPRPISQLTGAIGSKNHERKAESIRSLTPEQAAYALVEYQTAAIYGGKGNYSSQLQGSASGKGSGTPFMAARLSGSNRLSFRHDVSDFLGRWRRVTEALGGPIWALWGEAWSGDKQSELPAQRLDPAFIPLGRKVRLAAPSDGTFGELWFRGTETKRVLDHTEGGVLGDPFCPTVTSPKPKVRGTLDRGYNYVEVVMLLFGGEKGAAPAPSVAALVASAELERDDLTVVFEGVAYEQGKTLGMHRREVLLPAKGGDFFSDPSPVRTAHTRLLTIVKETKTALRGAARIVLSGAPKPRRGDEKKADRPAELLEQQVDRAYLDYLFRAAADIQAHGADERYDLPFLDWLQEAAKAALAAALPGLPVNTNQRLERELRAEAYLHGRLRKICGEVRAEEDPDGAD